MDESDVLRYVADRETQHFEIIEGSCGEGCYVVRYVDGRSTHDYLAPNLAGAFGCAERHWGVPTAMWRQARDGDKVMYLLDK